MNKEQERKAFEDAIFADRYDQITRRVFSDWLDENDYPEEANKQRKWTPEKQKAEDWLMDLAEIGGKTCLNYDEYCENYRGWRRGDENTKVEMEWEKITYEDLIQAGYDYLDDEEYFVQHGSERLRDLLSEDSDTIKFWECWSLVTEREVTEEIKKESPFSCSC